MSVLERERELILMALDQIWKNYVEKSLSSVIGLAHPRPDSIGQITVGSRSECVLFEARPPYPFFCSVQSQKLKRTENKRDIFNTVLPVLPIESFRKFNILLEKKVHA